METAAVHIAETSPRRSGRIPLVKDAHHPHRHRLAVHNPVGAEPPAFALGALEHPRRGQIGHRVGIIRIARHIREAPSLGRHHPRRHRSSSSEHRCHNTRHTNPARQPSREHRTTHNKPTTTAGPTTADPNPAGPTIPTPSTQGQRLRLSHLARRSTPADRRTPQPWRNTEQPPVRPQSRSRPADRPSPTRRVSEHPHLSSPSRNGSSGGGGGGSITAVRQLPSSTQHNYRTSAQPSTLTAATISTGPPNHNPALIMLTLICHGCRWWCFECLMVCFRFVGVVSVGVGVLWGVLGREGVGVGRFSGVAGCQLSMLMRVRAASISWLALRLPGSRRVCLRAWRTTRAGVCQRRHLRALCFARDSRPLRHSR